jgi:gluconate 2-dehydrogenase gamma chain
MAEKPLLSRREFIRLSASVVAALPLDLRGKEPGQQALASDGKLPEPWLTIAAVQQHMFPATANSPGAADIQALDYLKKMISMPDVNEQDRQFIMNGAGWLNEETENSHAKQFSELQHDEREAALRKIERSKAGERWLSILLTYLLEALLADPVYGGNTNTAGWQWLQHQPGFPRPGTDKAFHRLGTYKRRYTKA